MIELETYTHSRIAAYRTCPRKHLYAYERMVREVKSAPALSFGTAFHEGVRSYWLSRQSSVDPDERASLALAATDRSFRNEDLFSLAKLRVLITAYVSVWDQWSSVDVVAVEQPFRVPLRNPDTGDAHPRACLGGQIDLILRSRKTGHLAVVEHKTTSRDASPGSEYMSRLKLDAQIGIYFHAATAIGMAPTEVIYDAAIKPGQRPLKGSKGKPPETPAQYQERIAAVVASDPSAFIRRERVGRPDAEQEAVWRDVWEWVSEIEDAAAHGRWPRNTDACFRYGSACAYVPVCTGRTTIDDPILYRIGTKHGELQADAARTIEPDYDF